MGFLFELLVDFLSNLVGEAIFRTVGPWGCAAIVGMFGLAVLLIVWLT